MVELTDAEADALYSAAVARFATTLTAMSAPKSERDMWTRIAEWQDSNIKSVLAQAQVRSTF